MGRAEPPGRLWPRRTCSVQGTATQRPMVTVLPQLPQMQALQQQLRPQWGQQLGRGALGLSSQWPDGSRQQPWQRPLMPWQMQSLLQQQSLAVQPAPMLHAVSWRHQRSALALHLQPCQLQLTLPGWRLLQRRSVLAMQHHRQCPLLLARSRQSRAWSPGRQWPLLPRQ